jgi:signal transduction histidine kinase
MSRDEIQRRIRSLFYFLFGVIFTFLFILTSSYLDLINKTNTKHKDQTISFLTDGIKTRERFLYEEFTSRSFDSLSLRLSNFFTAKNIQKFFIVVIEDGVCVSGKIDLCNSFKDLSSHSRRDNIFSTENLGNLNILIPINQWGASSNFIGLQIPLNQISHQQTFFEKIFFYVIPFLILMLITIGIYSFTEVNLIRPTIKRIIEGEKLQLQKDMLKQIAHDIRSPVSVLKTVVDNKDLDREDAHFLISEALLRIQDIANDVLERERKMQHLTNIKDLVDNVVASKKVEFKKKSPHFVVFFNLTNDFFPVDPYDLYRAISNLINNAIEASRESAPFVQLFVSISDDALTLEIIDNGSGISEETMVKLNQGPFTTKPNGNGLGIHGTKKWLSQIKGKLIFTNNLTTAGAAVKLIIPGQ